MALTKVTKTGISDNSIDADKIEDGTIVAADIAPGTITNAKLAGSIANDKLANSSITVNGSSVSLGGSVSAGKIQWQSVKTTDFNAVAGEGYFVDTDSVGAVTATLPGSPSAGDTIAFKDYAGTFGTNSLTIARNGNNIQGVANDSEITTNRASVVLVYIDATKGWLYTNESNIGDLQAALFISATGGTVSTSGDYKIHIFTGDGCFSVSQVGNGPTVPAGGPSVVDYFVVAGGGSGITAGYGGGGGGAGGFRLSNSTCMPAPTTSPLASPTGLTITASTYPVTVGAGGAISSNPGSPSIFSTITSTAGGAGTHDSGGGDPGGSGGGGGGAFQGTYGAVNPGGSGNTPPVSPPQGQSGGSGRVAPGPGAGQNYLGGGGGGASTAGTPAPSIGNAGPGGDGSYVSTTFIPTCYGESGPVSCAQYFSGGGGGNSVGGGGVPTSLPQGQGGVGGGGNASGPNGPRPPAEPGQENSGGGGGGGGAYPGPQIPAGAGGKGIVAIRYKYQ
jgi:hypothetical protein